MSRRNWLWITAAFGALLIGGLLLGLYWFQRNLSDDASPVTTEIPAATDQPTAPEFANSRLLLFGDFYWGRYYDQLAARYGIETLLEGLETFEREQYDGWIATLECPVADQPIPYQVQVDHLKFNCQPRYLATVAQWFDAFNIGSNHNGDQEEHAGFAQTQQHLSAHGIQYFGHHQNQLDEICAVLAFPARSDRGDELALPIAFCSFNNVFTPPSAEEIAVISEYARYFPTIAMPQMGVEYVSSSDPLKEDTFRAMIDAGADLIAGGQPHWVQNSEVYRERLIMYSLGNFMFDQWFDADVQRGIGLDVDLTVTYDANVHQWAQWGTACSQPGNDCLERARSLGLGKPELSMAFDLVAADNSSRMGVTKGSAALLEALWQRTNWAVTLRELRQH